MLRNISHYRCPNLRRRESPEFRGGEQSLDSGIGHHAHDYREGRHDERSHGAEYRTAQKNYRPVPLPRRPASRAPAGIAMPSATGPNQNRADRMAMPSSTLETCARHLPLCPLMQRKHAEPRDMPGPITPPLTSEPSSRVPEQGGNKVERKRRKGHGMKNLRAPGGVPPEPLYPGVACKRHHRPDGDAGYPKPKEPVLQTGHRDKNEPGRARSSNTETDKQYSSLDFTLHSRVPNSECRWRPPSRCEAIHL
jgi:hypothetical protein